LDIFWSPLAKRPALAGVQMHLLFDWLCKNKVLLRIQKRLRGSDSNYQRFKFLRVRMRNCAPAEIAQSTATKRDYGGNKAAMKFEQGKSNHSKNAKRGNFIIFSPQIYVPMIIGQAQL